MIYDYVIIGNNINSLMLAYYLFKEDQSVIILDKKNINDHYFYTKNEIVYKNPVFSNNDVNFLNFLNELKIDFKLIGNKININFDLIGNFNLSELLIIYCELINEFTFNYDSKNIKLKDKIHLFSDKSISYIKSLCEFYNNDFNEITYYDFIQIVSNCIINEFYTINENELKMQIFNYFKQNTNIEIKFEIEFIDLIDNIVKTNNDNFKFNNKCIFCISPDKIPFINNQIKEQVIYNYVFKINEKYIEDDNILQYYKNNDTITFFSNTSKNFCNEIKIINKILNEELYLDKYIFLNNNKTIEDNIKRNFSLLNKINNKKKYRIYKNDSLVDIVKLFLIVKIFIK